MARGLAGDSAGGPVWDQGLGTGAWGFGREELGQELDQNTHQPSQPSRRFLPQANSPKPWRSKNDKVDKTSPLVSLLSKLPTTCNVLLSRPNPQSFPAGEASRALLVSPLDQSP